jgi:hypothetical protein
LKISRFFFFGKRNVSEKIFRGKKNTIFFNTFFSPPPPPPPQKIVPFLYNMENTVEPDRRKTIKWGMRIASWIPKATNTHSEYVIRIDFPLHKWLKERSSVLGRGYIEARSDTTQQSGQTPDKEVQIKNITFYVSG